MTTERAVEEHPEEETKSPTPAMSLRHDLRTPINQIIGYGEMLAEEAASEGHQQYVPDLEKIGITARNLLAKIDSLLLDGLAAAAPARASEAPEVKSGEYVAPAGSADGAAAEESRRLTAELERRNQFIRKTFGRYLSKDVVESLLASPEGLRLGGEKRCITIMMSDLRGFTALSERLDPEQVVAVLNNYLGKMAEIVTAYNGTIDEFIGDAILALFGAPIHREDDAERAVVCALQMQLAMREVNDENRKNGFPELEMGIALNTGECVVGNIGSQKRAKYGVVGSHVNLTGRIESYTVGGQILISKATADAVGAELKLGDELQLGAKGFREPVKVCEVLGIGGRHNLVLPARSEELRCLVREIPIAIDVIEGKHVAGESTEGKLVALSMGEAAISAARALERLSNLRLRLTGLNGVIIPGDLYAKVTACEESRYVLRFTSVPEEIKSFLRSTLANEVV